MSELVINGVNTLDPRMIGQKCIFSDGIHDQEGILTEVLTDGSTNPFMSERGYFYEYCELALGDKTPYDGKGQPVPDGVVVKVWCDNTEGSYYERTDLSERCYWDEDTHITYYQIQEQPVEQEKITVVATSGEIACSICGEKVNLPLNHNCYEEQIKQLQAQVNRLRNKLVEYADEDKLAGISGYGCISDPYEFIKDVLSQNPHQSLQEHDAKVIDGLIPDINIMLTILSIFSGGLSNGMIRSESEMSKREYRELIEHVVEKLKKHEQLRNSVNKEGER